MCTIISQEYIESLNKKELKLKATYHTSHFQT